jgi:osmotically-inducible protein OsmY
MISISFAEGNHAMCIPSRRVRIVRHPLSDAAIRTAVQHELRSDPSTSQLDLQVDVIDRRVFLQGKVPLDRDVHAVEEAAMHAPDVGEVIDMLDVQDVEQQKG